MTATTGASGGGFPPNFLWGAATSAYQVEGAVVEDARGPSIWDAFSHRPGRVVGGDTGDVAADHYHRWREDVGLMVDLGLTAYRFSIAWPRVQPEGRGRPNPAGLTFYSQLVDALLEHGIQPWVTLYHWDLPQALQDQGGWPERDTAGRFVDYAEAVFAALADRVRWWTTLNEPWCAAFLGYGSGEHAPGVRDPRAAVRAAHHLLLAHGQAVRSLRAIDPAASFGVTLDPYPVSAASGRPADHDAARRIDGLRNRLWLDPLLLGRYPTDVLEDLGRVVPLDHLRPGDAEAIAAPLDVLGVNYYRRLVVAAGRDGGGPSPWPGAGHAVFVDQSRPRTGLGWEIDPSGLVEMLARLRRDYPPVPLAITELGAAFDDRVGPDGQVHDPARVRFLDDHLRAARQALDAGADLRGLFVWSLLDNFEWAQGYSQRFGLVHVDFASGRRTPKDSAWWYRDAIKHGGPSEGDDG
jgi:beta-glucosidase